MDGPSGILCGMQRLHQGATICKAIDQPAKDGNFSYSIGKLEILLLRIKSLSASDLEFTLSSGSKLM